MAEQEGVPQVEDEEIEETPGYKPPAQKTLEEIQRLDEDDESLVKYKKALLGENVAGGGGGKNVVVERMALVVAGRDDIELDLTGDLSKLKSKPFTIKEGSEYKIKIIFRVNNEIVAGLKYFQVTYRKGIRVDKTNFMVGSYGPKPDPQFYQTPVEEAPKGMMARGHYTVKSKFTDDDKAIHLEWEWSFDIKKDWE
ncbi:rho GDP-dissociation inhibitor 1-like [Glandiceps talaboti]